jgi:hypothetical protein
MFQQQMLKLQQFPQYFTPLTPSIKQADSKITPVPDQSTTHPQ